MEQENNNCQFCVNNSLFVYDSRDPSHKKGIFQKGDKFVCVKFDSLKHQRNKGTYYVCDLNFQHKCYYFTYNK